MKRLLLVLLIFTGSGTLIWQFIHTSATQPIPAPTQTLEWFGEHVRLTEMTAEGNPKQILMARNVKHYTPDNITDLTDVTLEIMPTKAEDKPWQLSSDKGRLFHGENTQDITRIDLWHNVVLLQPASHTQSAATIKTSTLAIFPETEYAHTDQYTSVFQVGQHLEGQGMEIFFAEQTFHLLGQVSSAHETVQ